MELSPRVITGLQGIGVALAIGALVRLLRLPVPAPPTVWGALMIVGLTVGYLVVDWLMTR